jgi:glycosyltransferase involved in cell wall biosynthesis
LLDTVENDYECRPPAVIFIGSQHQNNGSLLLLEIAERAIKKMPNLHIYAADRFGDPAFRERYLQERRNKGLEDRLTLLPNVLPHELMQLLNKATIAINPNLRVDQQIMGIHTKLFEFMAAGLPIVTSDLPHQKEVIDATHAGLLAQPEDPDSFVEAIEFLVDNADKAKVMGKRGQQAFRNHYSWESQIPQLLAFYDEIAPGLSQ